MTSRLMKNPAALIDHTLLLPTTTEADIHLLCEDAVEYAFACVCIPPVFVSLAARNLYGSGVKVCSVIGFPCGYSSTRSKVQEASELVSAGAEEIDMVMQIGHFLSGNKKIVEEEIAQVVIAAQNSTVKVIVECCYLSNTQKIEATEMVCRAGADFIKTSTGFGSSGAAVADVELLVRTSAGRIGVKAAGGIRSLDDCYRFIAAGATRIGSSSGASMIKEWQQKELK